MALFQFLLPTTAVITVIIPLQKAINVRLPALPRLLLRTNLPINISKLRKVVFGPWLPKPPRRKHPVVSKRWTVPQREVAMWSLQPWLGRLLHLRFIFVNNSIERRRLPLWPNANRTSINGNRRDPKHPTPSPATMVASHPTLPPRLPGIIPPLRQPWDPMMKCARPASRRNFACITVPVVRAPLAPIAPTRTEKKNSK